MVVSHCSGRFSSLLLKVFVTLYILIFVSEVAPAYLSHTCPDTSTYDPNSTFQVNLNSLLSTLSADNISNYMFFNATAGNGPSDRAYGVFICRGDFTPAECHDCVVTATTEVLQRCPKQKKVLIWYDTCVLHYDNETFFSKMDDTSGLYVTSTANETDPDFALQVLQSTMTNVATQASNNISPAYGRLVRYFATGETKISGFNTIYSLVQCSPDLQSGDCNRCLRVAISELPNCCIGSPGGRVMLPSCTLAYERFKFFRDVDTPAVLPPGSSATPGGNGGMSAGAIIGIVVGVVVSVLLFVSLGFYFHRRRTNEYVSTQVATGGNEVLIPESLQYNLSTIGVATNNFSSMNKIGEGGFGDVFKGILSNGQEIAVKRLSKTSVQGVQEFKNEVLLVAKLQHRNLVRLVGFCLEKEEKLLIYEFVSNKSLDYFLFGREKQKLLDWSTRYKIIGGIALGIVYLHEHSRLKIIHRDLKASNVLLDGDMNPKISDFGMARLVGIDQSQTNTNRIVGTFGYMAPEYAMHGEFSVKSDVFSFGVLLLEIISGKKNNRSYYSEGPKDLLSHAWKRWKDGTPLDLADPTMGDTLIGNEVLRCIHIGLLCVQEDPTERPTMASVLLMLNSFSVPLPLPHQPAFFIRSRAEGTQRQSEVDSEVSQRSTNEASVTELYPR